MDDRQEPRLVSPATAVGTVVVAVALLSLVAWLVLVRGGPPTPSVPPVVERPPTWTPEPPTSSEPDPTPTLPGVPPSLCPDPILHPLTALSFNIHAGLGGGGLNLDRIAEEITAWDADVVLLQEVDSGRPRTARQDQARLLGRLTGMNAVYGGNQEKPDGGSIGNAVLSRFPIVESNNIALPRAGGREQRGLLHAVVDVNGVEVSVYSTHWDHHAITARRAQASTVAGIVRDDPRPALVGGDMNTVSGSPPLRALRRAGLRDAWRVGEGAGLTVPAGNPRRRIDFVLHDRRFDALQAAVLRSAISDHRAVWARLQLRETLECLAVGEE